MNGAAISLPGGGSLAGVKLSERLQWILDNRGISASALSLQAGQSRAYVRKLIEREPIRPDFNALERIAEIGGVPPRWLTHGEGPMPEATAPPRPAAPELRVEREDIHVPADDEVPLETALFNVFTADRRGDRRYATADFDAARAAIRATHRKTHPDADLEAHAARLLDAARQLRAEGIPTDTGNLMHRAAVGKTERAAEVVREVSDAYNEEAAAALRAKGYEPDAGRARAEALLAARRTKREVDR